MTTERAFTGVGSCLTWHYRINPRLRDEGWGWSSNGDRLDVELWADDSTGGNPPEGQGLNLTIQGNWEVHEFLSVLQCFMDDLRSKLRGTQSIYADDPEDEDLVQRLGLGAGEPTWRND